MSTISGHIDECSVSRPEAIMLNIKLDYDKQECLFINSDDNPKILAKEFAAKHELDAEVEKDLEMVISEQMALFNAKVVEKCERNAKDDEKSIHNRLYLESKFAKRSGYKKAEPVRETQVSTINYGLLMYEQNKGLAREKVREKFAIKLSRYEKETKELTFHPSIPGNMSTSTTNSELFIKPKGLQRTQYMPQAARELQECSFKPKINSNIQSSKNIHEKLYMQKLKTPKSTKSIQCPKLKPEERQACMSRLLTSHLRSQAKLQKQRNKLEQLQELSELKPKMTSESGKYIEGSSNNADLKRLYGKEIKTEEEKVDIYKAHRISCYKQIFESLNSDPDGLVSEEMISNSELDNNYCTVLKKIIKKGSMEQGVNLSKFINIMENGINYLNIQDRILLLNRY